MERFEREQAHPLSLEDLKEMTKKEVSNPCLESLIYVETRATEKRPRKLFPAYPFDIVEGNEEDELILYVVQFIMQHYNTACISIPISEIGVKCRFWNLPPTEKLLDLMPMADSREVQ